MNINNLCMFEGTLTKDPVLDYSGEKTKGHLTITVDRGYGKEDREKAKNNNQPTADFVTCSFSGGTADLIAAHFNAKGKAIKVLCSYFTYSKDVNGQKEYSNGFRIEQVGWPSRDFTDNNGGNNNNGSYRPQGQNQNQGRQGNNNNVNRGQSQSQRPQPPQNNFQPESDDEYIPF